MSLSLVTSPPLRRLHMRPPPAGDGAREAEDVWTAKATKGGEKHERVSRLSWGFVDFVFQTSRDPDISVRTDFQEALIADQPIFASVASCAIIACRDLA